MTFPHLVIAGISRSRSRQVMVFLTRNRLLVRRIAGLVMFLIAVWNLVLFFYPVIFR